LTERLPKTYRARITPPQPLAFTNSDLESNKTAAVILPHYIAGSFVGTQWKNRDWLVSPDDQQYLETVDRPVAECTLETDIAFQNFSQSHTVIVVRLYDDGVYLFLGLLLVDLTSSPQTPMRRYMSITQLED